MLSKLFDFSVWRDRLLLIIVALLPWQARIIRDAGAIGGSPWEQGTVSLYALEIALLAALFCHLIARTLNQTGPPREQPAFFRIWALFLLYAVFSTFWARDVQAGMFSWFHLFDGFALAYLVAVSHVPLRRVCAAFLVGASLAAAIGLWQFFAQASFPSTWLGIAEHLPSTAGVAVVETAAGRFLRAYGPFPHPNILGGYLAAAVLIAAGLFIETESLKERRAQMAVLGLSLAGLLVSFSRSAWVAAAAAYVVASVRSKGWGNEERLRLHRLTVALVAAVALLVGVSAPIVSSRFDVSARLEQMSISDRLLSISQGIELFREHPATGVGIGNMVPAAFDDLWPKREGYRYQPAHLVPLLAAAELGFFGLMMLLGACIAWIIEAATVIPLVARPLRRFALAAPVVIIIAGFADHYPMTLFAGTMLSGFLFGLFLKAESTA